MNENETVGDPGSTASQRLRSQMPVAGRYAYFDHAAVAPLPSSTRDAMIRYAEEACEHGDALWLEWSSKVEGLRKSAAKMLNAQPSEIALVNNTTQGINLVAEGFPWREGDNVVVPANEFPSNILPWQNLARRGVEVRAVPVSDSEVRSSKESDGRVTAAMLSEYVDTRTRLIAVSWVGFATGFRIEVGEVVEMAHRKGALVLLDAIQGLGAFPLDVAATDVDFVCADGHKWMLGPEGAAIFYCKESHLDLLEPVGLGWNSLSQGAFDAQWTDDYQSRLKTVAARYEGGTTNMAGMLGLRHSVDVLLDTGLNSQPSEVEAAILSNVERLDSELSRAGFQTLLPTEPRSRSGIVGVQLLQQGTGLDDAQLWSARKHLLEKKIVTSVRARRLRLATHAYNDEEDIQRLVEGLVGFRCNNL